jgi:pyruvate/2-oxoglutarate/acetoin dehydrogenase E1 component
MTVRDALNSALDEEMSADPSVFLMGEEVSPGKKSFCWSFSLFSVFFHNLYSYPFV